MDCPTRYGKCLDLCYGSIKGAYKSALRAPLGKSDHHVVYLAPTYKPVLKREKTEKKLVPVWSEDSIQELMGCFECTDWDLFKSECTDLDDLTETVTSYIEFCEDLVIHKKPCIVFPNNKPWITKQVKSSINLRNIYFKQGDSIRYKEANKQVRNEVKLAKLRYKEKIETMFTNGKSHVAWDGVKSIIGTKQKRKCISLGGKSDYELADAFNSFYVRFDNHDFSRELSDYRGNSVIQSTPVKIQINEADVRSCFSQVKVRKSPGPDHIGGRLLKNCAEQLSGIYSFIFNESLKLSKVPRLWKDAIVVPIAKKRNSSSLGDYRPVALTSLIMKSFEKIVRKEILTLTQPALDPMQFAYRSGRGVDDATCTLLNMILGHLEGKKSHARLLFIDFSSAFNCVQPHILAKKLIDTFQLDLYIVCWLVDFLINRSQRVRVNGVLSNILMSSTGTPQGCVLSPLLFSLYTDDCRSVFNGRHIVKFADDSVIVSLLTESEPDVGPVIDNFIQWCDDSFLNINASKTKEMCFDFRKKSSAPVLPFIIKGQQVEVVKQYKYLGTIIDDKLQFEENTDIIRGKALQRMHFLRKLRLFNMDVSFMKMFYTCFIEAVLSFSIVCWYGNLNVKNRRKLTSIVTMCSKIVGTDLRTISQIYECRTIRKGQVVLSDATHPLGAEFQLLPSGRRFRLPLCKSNRYRNSFIPAAIKFLNDFM